MKVGGKSYRSIWEENGAVRIIDQRRLPHEFKVVRLSSLEDFATAIRDMWVRGAPLIGATAAWGIAEAMARDPSDEYLEEVVEALLETRPTAINLRWALDEMQRVLGELPNEQRAPAARSKARSICDDDVEINRRIGQNGLSIIQNIAKKKSDCQPVRILTHCNAGWIATVDWGTATSPMYQAHDAGVPVHIFVDETRPRNQGALLTAWELGEHGVSHDLIVDNAGGHLMQRGEVDVVITGTDRTTAAGDVCNKIGTYLKALAAKDNNIPFYVALPSPTIDWTLTDGLAGVPIEERNGREVTHVQGKLGDGSTSEVQISPDATGTRNPAFDVTPARLVTGLITERGIARPSKAGLAKLFPEKSQT